MMSHLIKYYVMRYIHIFDGTRSHESGRQVQCFRHDGCRDSRLKLLADQMNGEYMADSQTLKDDMENRKYIDLGIV